MLTNPVLQTARLILRPPALSDFDRWCELFAHEPSARHIGGVQPPAAVFRAMASMSGCWTLTGVSMFSVLDRQTGRWLGRIGPWQPHGWPGTEVGWALHPDAQGRGIALEAATACMDYAIDVLGWTDLIHTIAPANLASQRLAARLGATLRGPGQLPAPYQNEPVEVWGQTAAEWRARAGTVGSERRPASTHAATSAAE